jgi:hypothetical protein
MFWSKTRTFVQIERPRKQLAAGPVLQNGRGKKRKQQNSPRQGAAVGLSEPPPHKRQRQELPPWKGPEQYPVGRFEMGSSQRGRGGGMESARDRYSLPRAIQAEARGFGKGRGAAPVVNGRLSLSPAKGFSAVKGASSAKGVGTLDAWLSTGQLNGGVDRQGIGVLRDGIGGGTAARFAASDGKETAAGVNGVDQPGRFPPAIGKGPTAGVKGFDLSSGNGPQTPPWYLDGIDRLYPPADQTGLGGVNVPGGPGQEHSHQGGERFFPVGGFQTTRPKAGEGSFGLGAHLEQGFDRAPFDGGQTDVIDRTPASFAGGLKRDHAAAFEFGTRAETQGAFERGRGATFLDEEGEGFVGHPEEVLDAEGEGWVGVPNQVLTRGKKKALVEAAAKAEKAKKGKAEATKTKKVKADSTKGKKVKAASKKKRRAQKAAENEAKKAGEVFRLPLRDDVMPISDSNARDEALWVRVVREDGSKASRHEGLRALKEQRKKFLETDPVARDLRQLQLNPLEASSREGLCQLARVMGGGSPDVPGGSLDVPEGAKALVGSWKEVSGSLKKGKRRGGVSWLPKPIVAMTKDEQKLLRKVVCKLAKLTVEEKPGGSAVAALPNVQVGKGPKRPNKAERKRLKAAAAMVSQFGSVNGGQSGGGVGVNGGQAGARGQPVQGGEGVGVNAGSAGASGPAPPVGGGAVVHEVDVGARKQPGGSARVNGGGVEGWGPAGPAGIGVNWGETGARGQALQAGGGRSVNEGAGRQAGESAGVKVVDLGAQRQAGESVGVTGVDLGTQSQAGESLGVTAPGLDARGLVGSAKQAGEGPGVNGGEKASPPRMSRGSGHLLLRAKMPDYHALWSQQWRREQEERRKREAGGSSGDSPREDAAKFSSPYVLATLQPGEADFWRGNRGANQNRSGTGLEGNSGFVTREVHDYSNGSGGRQSSVASPQKSRANQGDDRVGSPRGQVERVPVFQGRSVLDVGQHVVSNALRY